jgi:hypothetical protein
VPADLFKRCTERLNAATSERGNPWRTPALATAVESGPEVRTVVLRAVHSNPFQLDFHTDRRSQKGRQLRDRDTVAWMFYDGTLNEQLRCRGPVTVHSGDAAARAAWDQLQAASRALYCQVPGPGTPLQGEAPSQDETFGFGNFLLVRCTISSMDWLQLGDTGSVRVHMEANDGTWASQRVAP